MSFLRFPGQQDGSCSFYDKHKPRKSLFVLLRIQSSVVAYTEIICLVSQFRAIGAAPHLNIELPDAGTNHVISFTGHQHLGMQRNDIMKDCILKETNPGELVQLLIVIFVSSVVTKQIQQTILSRRLISPNRSTTRQPHWVKKAIWSPLRSCIIGIATLGLPAITM